MEETIKYYLLIWESEKRLRVYQYEDEQWQAINIYGNVAFDFDDHDAEEFWTEWSAETGYIPAKDVIDIAELYYNVNMLPALQKLADEANAQGIRAQTKWKLARIKDFLGIRQEKVHKCQYGNDNTVIIELSNGEKMYARRLDGRPFAADDSVQVEPQNVAPDVSQFSAMDFQQVLQRMREEKQQRSMHSARKERKHDDG